MKQYDFSGIWLSSHYKDKSRDSVTSYYVTLSLDGDDLVVESLPNEDHSRMSASFRLKDNVATGSYRSHNAPNTAARAPLFEALYYGAAQLVIDPNGKGLRGKGVGFSKSGKVQLTNWEITYFGDKLDNAG